MEQLKDLEDYFSLEIAFLRQNTPKTAEEIDLKSKEISDKIEEYKRVLIPQRDEMGTQVYNKIFKGFKEDVESIKTALKEFISKYEKTPLSSSSSEDEEEKNNLDEIIFDKNSFKIIKKERKPKVKKDSNIKTINYDFPMETAIKCIPEFFGNPEELTPFIDQINFFANYIPTGMDQTPLINLIKLKLKGKASSFVNNLAGLRWKQIEKLLIEEYNNYSSLEDILKEIETLSQRHDETFKSYKDRTLEILYNLEKLEFPVNDFAMKSLTFHFIGGLKNKSIRDEAENNADKSFRELLKSLEEKCLKKEKYDELNKRLKSISLSGNSNINSQQNPNWNKDTNYNPQYKQNNNYAQRYNNHPNYRNSNSGNFRAQNNFQNQQNHRFSNQHNYNDLNPGSAYNSNRFNDNENQRFNTNRGNYNQQQNNFSNNSKPFYQRKN